MARISVVIVSHHRPGHLRTCLTAVLRQNPAEVIVVADSGSRAVAQGRDVRYLRFEERNIAAARNCGLAAVTSPLVAFIDDDSVPSPGWLDRLAAPFAESRVLAATGYVRLGDTPRWQFRGERIDCLARVTPLDLDGDDPVVLPPPANGAILTIGTNCAFRCRSLADVGLFDPAYRYFLDESDVNMRLSQKGALTAIVPTATVRHYRAIGPYRRRDGRMTDLVQVAASLKSFLERYAPPDVLPEALADALAVQDRSLLRAMVRGDLEPGDVQRGRQQLRCGAAGRIRGFPGASGPDLRSGSGVAPVAGPGGSSASERSKS